MNEVVKKNPANLFQPGKSGNPNGRPKGSKNRITLMKLALEGELRVQLKHDMRAILAKAIELAKAGDTQMIKLLVDKALPTSRAPEDDTPRENIQIVVGRLDGENAKTVINGETVNQTEETFDGIS